ncbi:hypothetical protein ACUV84_035344 [Puccinellia chinampoensis]
MMVAARGPRQRATAAAGQQDLPKMVHTEEEGRAAHTPPPRLSQVASAHTVQDLGSLYLLLVACFPRIHEEAGAPLCCRPSSSWEVLCRPKVLVVGEQDGSGFTVGVEEHNTRGRRYGEGAVRPEQ